MKDTTLFRLNFFMSLLLLMTLASCLTSQTLQQNINFINNRLRSRLVRQDVPFKFMKTWAAKKGLYESSVHINFLDKKNTWLTEKLRNSPIGDINMFVTSFVLYTQIQAQQLGTVKINDHDFSICLESLSDFRDKNIEYGIPQYIFWPQKFVNGSWSAEPVNLINLADIWPKKVSRVLNKFLEYSGLWMIEYVKDLVFSIPADNDDSGVNLALLGLMKQTNSPHFEWWNNFNFNKIAYYQSVLKYAYRPFDSNNPFNKFANQIDPRTYFVIRQFIEAKNLSASLTNSTPSLILPTTWLLKEDQQVVPQLQIPLMSNNVDATVCCNVLFGIFYQVLTGLIKLQDLPELTQLIEDTVNFLVFAVQNQIELRPDIILVYYPSKYDFYWFLARIVQLLKRYDANIFAQNIQPLIYAKSKLEALMKIHGTVHIMRSKKQEGKGTQCFWVQFIGNYAGKQRNDDAIFNTVMAVNAMYDTWIVRHKSELVFDQQTPQEVKHTIDAGINYLVQKIGNRMKEMNSFFSGSTKTFTTTSSNFNYPANVHQYKGKNIDPQTTKQADINYAMRFLVKGTIEPQNYQQLCNLKWFERSVPLKFEGYNQIPFPFWSSSAITEAMLISVLSKKLKAK